MRIATLVTWLIGAGLLAALFATNDAGKLFAAAWRLHGWLIVIALYHGVPLLFDVLGWRRLFEHPPDFLRLLRIRWIGEAVNSLLPVPHLGEILRAKVPHDEGSDLTKSATSVIGDVTVGLATQIVFIATGLAYFALLAHDRARREAMGARARRYAEHRLPTWADVLGEDILSTWQSAFAAARQSDVRPLRPAAHPAS